MKIGEAVEDWNLCDGSIDGFINLDDGLILIRLLPCEWDFGFSRCLTFDFCDISLTINVV